MITPTESTATDPLPKDRYIMVPPAVVRLVAGDLESSLPDGAWIGTPADQKRELTLPAGEILETNYPRIRLRRLSDLLPGCIRNTPASPEWIALPADRIALAYRPQIRRLADSEARPMAPGTLTDPRPPAALTPAWKRLPKPTLAPAPASRSEEMNPRRPSATGGSAPLAEACIGGEAQESLQELFATRDALTVSRMVELVSQLSGIAACTLSRGTESVRSINFPSGLEALSPGSDTLDLTRKLESSSGLRIKPAVTLYVESRPITILQRGSSSLLVIHATPGLTPDVLAKLERVLAVVEQASATWD